MSKSFIQKAASRTATAVGTAVIVTVVVAGGLSVAQAATESVANNSVTSAKIVDNSITSADIRNATIQGIDIKASTIEGVDILDGTIISGDIGDASIAGADIGSGAVGTAEIANESVGGVDILNGSVNSVDIATGSINSEEVFDGTLQRVDMTAGVLPYMAEVDAGNESSAATLVRARGATSATWISTGVHRVVFSADITNCYWLVSSSDRSGDSVEARILSLELATANAIDIMSFVGQSYSDMDVLDGFSLVVYC